MQLWIFAALDYSCMFVTPLVSHDEAFLHEEPFIRKLISIVISSEQILLK